MAQFLIELDPFAASILKQNYNTCAEGNPKQIAIDSK
jgi:hypothetical protein